MVIGHDWGAVAANGLAAMPDSPFRKAVLMSVPPSAALTTGRSPALLRLLPRQLLRSWYISYFQLPFAPERSGSWIVPLLWVLWGLGAVLLIGLAGGAHLLLGRWQSAPLRNA